MSEAEPTFLEKLRAAKRLASGGVWIADRFSPSEERVIPIEERGPFHDPAGPPGEVNRG